MNRWSVSSNCMSVTPGGMGQPEFRLILRARLASICPFVYNDESGREGSVKTTLDVFDLM